MSDFRQRVLFFVKSIPKGKVVSYGQVAAHSGSPRAARQVGGILRRIDHAAGIPWWRVVNNQGIISIKGNFEASKELQRQLLRKDGIIIDEDFRLNIEQYRFRPFM